ncbi:MAG: GAF domain-containing sensor histidine kinase [Eubacteriales bacterium]
MEAEKLKILETLTGIGSSKKNYYVELQQKIEEVTLRNKQLEIINHVARSFTVDLPIERIISYLLEKLNMVIPIDDFNLSTLVDGECRCFVGGCESSPHKNSCSPNKVCSYIIKNKKSLVLPDEAKDFGLKISQELNEGSAVFVPLTVKNTVIGILSVKSGHQKAYSIQDVAFLEQLAAHLSVGLNNMRLFSEIRLKEREWEDTFLAIADAIVIINTKFEIIRYNEAALKIFQLGANIGKKCYEVIRQRSAPCKKCHLFAEKTASTERFYQFIERFDKNVYDVYAYPMLWSNGRIKGVVETIKDVTQQMAVESQLIQSEKLAAIGKLAAGVAHELNSPLTAILGDAQLLLREFPPDHENRVLMEDIKQCGVRCKNIIQNLLSFARKQQLDGELVSINEVVDRAVCLVGHQIRQDRIELQCLLEPDLPEISGSSQQLEQVIINLLINAKDALGGREANRVIAISSGRCFRNEQDYLFICIEDHGCGMYKEELSEIFTPFYTTKDVGKGTGLGLAVSMGIIQNHGGNIECESTPGTGSKFTVLLPIKQLVEC